MATLRAEPGKVFEFEGKIEIPAAKLRTGENKIVIQRKGTGVLYAAAWLTYFTREAQIKAAGNEVFAGRKYFRTPPGADPLRDLQNHPRGDRAGHGAQVRRPDRGRAFPGGQERL